MFTEQMNCQLKKSSKFTDNVNEESFGLDMMQCEDISMFLLCENWHDDLTHNLFHRTVSTHLESVTFVFVKSFDVLKKLECMKLRSIFF